MGRGLRVVARTMPVMLASRHPGDDLPVACPYLGLHDDPRSHFLFATPAHRCHVRRRPAVIELGHQGRFCLSREYPVCPRYRPLAPGPTTTTGPTTATGPTIAPDQGQGHDNPAAEPARSPVGDILKPVPAPGTGPQADPTDDPSVSRRQRPVRRGLIVLLVLIATGLLIRAIVGSALGPLPTFDLPALGVFAVHRQIAVRGSQVHPPVLYAVERHGVF